MPHIRTVKTLSIIQQRLRFTQSNKCLHFYNDLKIHSINRWRRQWQPTPVPLPGKSHGQRSLVGCSPWGCCELDTTERLHFHFSLSCIGEGNGNPLQCSCLENPRDRGAWWVSISGVTQSRTWLKQLSSSSSISRFLQFYYDIYNLTFIFIISTFRSSPAHL